MQAKIKINASKYQNLTENYNKVKEIKDYILNNIDKNIFTIISKENSSPYILTVSAKGLRGEVLMHCLEKEGVIVGNGSACSSKNRFSRVIEACGYANDVLDGVIRISFSTENTISEAEIAVGILNDCAKKLKGILS
jgi:cysteine desulfurase